jgi:hypothetical protein
MMVGGMGDIVLQGDLSPTSWKHKSRARTGRMFLIHLTKILRSHSTERRSFVQWAPRDEISAWHGGGPICVGPLPMTRRRSKWALSLRVGMAIAGILSHHARVSSYMANHLARALSSSPPERCRTAPTADNNGALFLDVTAFLRNFSPGQDT